MDVLALLRLHEKTLKEQFGVAKIGIFGSFARGGERPESDVDVLVVFQKYNIKRIPISALLT